MLMSSIKCKIRNIAPVCSDAMLRGVMFCIVFCIIIQFSVFISGKYTSMFLVCQEKLQTKQKIFYLPRVLSAQIAICHFF